MGNKTGLITDQVVAGKKSAAAIDARAWGINQAFDQLVLDPRRVKLAYYNPEKCNGVRILCGGMFLWHMGTQGELYP